MADFPTSLFTARATENLPGIVYDPTKKQNLFSEDFQNLGGEISAIEICLGLRPKWASASVAERIKGIRSLSDANEAVITIKGANVGIGTILPATTLDIIGIGTPSSGTGVSSVTYPFAKTDTTSRNVMVLKSNEAVGSAWKLLITSKGNATVASRYFSLQTSNEGVADGGILALQANGGFVGIGTTSPTTPSHIYSSFATGITVERSSNGNSNIKYSNSTAGVFYAGLRSLGDAFAIGKSPDLTDNTNTIFTVLSSGNVGIGTTTPTAVLHLKSGTATAGTAPFKLTAGVLLTTPELGAIEFTDNGTTSHLYVTVNIAGVLTRHTII